LWADTFQFNYWSPSTIKFMTELLVVLASRADAIRCDMAMLALNDVWERSWGQVMQEGGFLRPQQEFWQVAIDAAKVKSPSTQFFAEAYNYQISRTPEKELLVDLGFDYVYDKDPLDHLQSGGNLDKLRAYITGRSQEQLAHTTHSVENHDEPRAAAALGGQQKAFVGSVLTSTLPGARLFFRGQFDGNAAKLVAQLRRAEAEQSNVALHGQYDRFLDLLKDPVFHKGTWTYIDVPKEGTSWRLLAWRWSLGDTKRLVVVNFSDQEAWGVVKVADAEGRGSDTLQVTDMFTDITYQRSASEMRDRGMTCGLKAWSSQIFSY